MDAPVVPITLASTAPKTIGHVDHRLAFEIGCRIPPETTNELPYQAIKDMYSNKA